MHPENPNLVAGTYTLRVTDNNSCTSSASYTLINPPAITLNLPLIRNVSCHGEDDGAINSLASGGSGGFTYTWSNGFVGPNLVNLAPAIYSVTVEDTNGCTKKHQQPLQNRLTSQSIWYRYHQSVVQEAIMEDWKLKQGPLNNIILFGPTE